MRRPGPRISASTGAIAALVLAACGPREPARPPIAAPPPEAAPSPAPPEPPARWIATGGATRVGPRTARGTLLLVGGRRAIVSDAGAVELERAPSPEPLIDVAEVPTASGPRLVARGAHAIVRLDDPLGAPTPLARSEAEITRLGAWPGLVVIWDASSTAPRFVDVASGEPRPAPRVPDLPMSAVAFGDARHGAAVLEGAGLCVTADGGATFRAIAAAPGAGDALRIAGLRGAGGALLGFTAGDGREAEVDPARGTLGPLVIATARPGDAPLVRWIRTTGRDPVDAAVVAGAITATGAIVVASHGLVARLDAATGAVVDVAEFAHGAGMNACSLGRAGRTAWIGCALTERATGDLYDPFGVLRLDLAGGITPDRPTLARNGEVEVRVGPRGGAALLGPCGADEAGDACVRQPDGKWRTIDLGIEGDGEEHAVGPLADGRVALLRGLGATAGGERGPRVVTVGDGAVEREIAPVAWPSPAGPLRVESPIEEDEGGVLRFALSDGETTATFAVAPGADVATPQRIPGATRVRLRGGHGVAVGEGRVLASTDGGASFVEVAAPAAVREAATRVARSGEDPRAIAASEVGARVESFVRLGWGDAGTSAAPDAAVAGVVLAPRAPAAIAPAVLACRVEGDAPRSPATFATSTEARALLDPKGAPPRGSRREIAANAGPRATAVDAMATLEQVGPEGAAPARWTLRWIDPLEIAGKVRSWSGPAPAGAAWGASVRGAAVAGDRAMVTVRSAGRTWLLRAAERGAADVTDVPFDLVPGEGAAVGPDDASPAAWLREEALVVWPKGGAPRVAARVAGRAPRAVGASRDGALLVLGDAEASLARSIAVDAGGAPTPLPLDGWARLPPLRTAATALAACGPRPAGARVLVPRARLPIALEGQDVDPEAVVADVRVGRTGACLAGVAVQLRPTPAGLDVVRVDLAGRRAEAVSRAGPTAQSLRRLACTLTPRP